MDAARTLFETFIHSDTPEAQSDFMHTLLQNGYTHLRYLVDELTESIRQAEEADFAKISEWIERASRLLPEPAEISPYYQSVWDQLSKLVAYKQDVFAKFPAEARSGEWQIVFNNPNSIDELLCIPSLSFTEAGYLYAKYKSELKKAEILRLQKVVDQMTTTGSK